MLFGKNLMPDGRPTMSEWPVRVWAEKELKEEFRIQARKWIKGEFEEYRFVYAPERKTAKNSYAYVFGYGKEEVLFLKKSEDGGTHPAAKGSSAGSGGRKRAAECAAEALL